MRNTFQNWISRVAVVAGLGFAAVSAQAGGVSWSVSINSPIVYGPGYVTTTIGHHPHSEWRHHAPRVVHVLPPPPPRVVVLPARGHGHHATYRGGPDRWDAPRGHGDRADRHKGHSRLRDGRHEGHRDERGGRR